MALGEQNRARPARLDRGECGEPLDRLVRLFFACPSRRLRSGRDRHRCGRTSAASQPFLIAPWYSARKAPPGCRGGKDAAPLRAESGPRRSFVQGGGSTFLAVRDIRVPRESSPPCEILRRDAPNQRQVGPHYLTFIYHSELLVIDPSANKLVRVLRSATTTPCRMADDARFHPIGPHRGRGYRSPRAAATGVLPGRGAPQQFKLGVPLVRAATDKEFIP